MSGEAKKAEADRERQDRINQRIQGRKWAEECLAEMEGPFREAFVKCVIEQNKKETSPKAEISKRSYKQLAAIQQLFGMYREQPFDQVPLSYLDWMLDATENYLKDLREYLNHPSTKKIRDLEFPYERHSRKD